MNNLEYKLFYRRHLPHIQPPGATLFVTFRLVNSIPKATLRRLLAQAERIDTVLTEISDPQERVRRAYLEQRRLFGKWDTALDCARNGPFWLRDPEIATLVVDSINYRDGQVYDHAQSHPHGLHTPTQ